MGIEIRLYFDNGLDKGKRHPVSTGGLRDVRIIAAGRIICPNSTGLTQIDLIFRASGNIGKMEKPFAVYVAIYICPRRRSRQHDGQPIYTGKEPKYQN
jgi:hypothetical protein